MPRKTTRNKALGSSAPILRLAREDDLEELLRLEQESFVDYYAPHRFDRSDFYFNLQRPNGIFWVAAKRRGLAGYIDGVVIERKGQKRADLLSIAVEEEARGKGLGGKLMQRFLDEAKQRGCASAVLEVAKENSVGQHLFKKLGFKRSRSLPDYYGGDHDGIRMSRLI